MSNISNPSRPPDIWTAAQRTFGPKVRAIAAGLGPNAFSSSLPFLAPFIQPQPTALPKAWNTAQAVHRATQTSPVLQGHLTQPGFAAAAQHDIGPLHRLETAVKALKANDVEGVLFRKFIPGNSLIDAVQTHFGNKPGDMQKSFLAGAAGSVGSAVRGVGAAADAGLRLSMGERKAAALAQARAHGGFSPMPGDLVTAVANPLFDSATWLKKGVRDTPLSRGSEMAGNLAPGIAVSVANPIAGAAYFAAQGADSQSQAAIRAGKAGTWQADLGVLGNAGVQGGLGLIPGAKLGRFLPEFTSPAAKLAMRVGTRTAAGTAFGATSNVLGNLIEKITVNPDKTVWDGAPESAIWGGVLGAAHAGKDSLPGARSASHAALGPDVHAPQMSHLEGQEPGPIGGEHPVIRATAAIVNHHTLTEAVKTARDSTLRRENPDRFQAFTANVADAADVPPLQVAPDVLDAVLATPEGQRVQAAVPDLPERVVAARDAGTEVSIPAHEYLAHVGPELHDAIAGHVRLGQDALTPAEAVADQQERIEDLQNASAKAEASAEDPEAFSQSRQAVTDAYRQKLDRETVGKLAPEQRVRSAELAGHAFAVEAAKQGVTPMEVYQDVRAPTSTLNGGIGTSSENLFREDFEKTTEGEVFAPEHGTGLTTPSSRLDPFAEEVTNPRVDTTDEPEDLSRTFSAIPESYIKPGVGIDMRSAPSGSETNAAGYPRNRAWFWRRLARLHPEYFDLENRKLLKKGRAPTINQTWLAEFPAHAGFQGKRLIHHHIDQGPIAVPIPEPVHQIWHKVLHPHK